MRPTNLKLNRSILDQQLAMTLLKLVTRSKNSTLLALLGLSVSAGNKISNKVCWILASIIYARFVYVPCADKE